MAEQLVDKKGTNLVAWWAAWRVAKWVDSTAESSVGNWVVPMVNC